MTTPRVHKRRVPSRRTVQVNATESAARALAGLERGHELVVMTYGQFSLVDALRAILRHTGPADVSLSTWTAGNSDTVWLSQLVQDGVVRSMRWLVDGGFERREPRVCAELRRLFGDEVIRTTRSHAKFGVIRNESWSLALLTSMNLTGNPRLETIHVADDPDLCGFLEETFDAFFEVMPQGEFRGELPGPRALSGIRARPLPLSGLRGI